MRGKLTDKVADSQWQREKYSRKVVMFYIHILPEESDKGSTLGQVSDFFGNFILLISSN